jgi:hypothetical protein
MAATKTHNEFMLRPPPGARFTLAVSIFGHDAFLQFERGREREVLEWIHNWADTYILPEVLRAEARDAQATVETGDVKAARLQAENRENIARVEANMLAPRQAKGNRMNGFRAEMFETPPQPPPQIAEPPFVPKPAQNIDAQPAAPIVSVVREVVVEGE